MHVLKGLVAVSSPKYCVVIELMISSGCIALLAIIQEEGPRPCVDSKDLQDIQLDAVIILFPRLGFGQESMVFLKESGPEPAKQLHDTKLEL